MENLIADVDGCLNVKIGLKYKESTWECWSITMNTALGQI